MSVGNVKRRHLSESGRQSPRRRIRNDPDPVGNAVGGDEIVFRRGLGDPTYDGVDVPSLPVGNKNRARLGADGIHVSDPLLLLVRPGMFVFLDQPRLVFPNADGGDDAVLATAGHFLGINVQTGLRILAEDIFLPHLLQIPGGCLKDRPLLDMRVVRKIDLRFFHVEKTPGIAAGYLPGLLHVDDVVGESRDSGGIMTIRTEGPKGDNTRHE